MKLLVLNSTVLTSPGTYEMVPVSENEAIIRIAFAATAEGFEGNIYDTEANCYYDSRAVREETLAYTGLVSAVGHQAAVEVLNAVLRRGHAHAQIELNRIAVAQEPGQDALVFKLKTRVAEGEILTPEKMREIGYEFFLLRRLPKPSTGYGWRTNAPEDAADEIYAADVEGACLVVERRQGRTINVYRDPRTTAREIAEQWERSYSHLRRVPQHTGGGMCAADPLSVILEMAGEQIA